MVKKFLSLKSKGILTSLISLTAIFSGFQNCQKVNFNTMVDPNAFNDKPSATNFCSAENITEIRVPKSTFDSQSVCTDNYNLNSTVKLGKVCEDGPEVFAIPETFLEYKNCNDMTICGIKFESKVAKNESYLLTFKNLPIGCSAQLNIYKDETKGEPLFSKLFNAPVPACPVCNYTNIATCGVCEDPIISACGYNDGTEFSSLNEITTPCLSGTLGDSPNINSTAKKVEWTCKGSGANLSTCSYNIKPGSCELNFTAQNINYDTNTSFSVSLSGAVSEASSQNPEINCTDASGNQILASKTSTPDSHWDLSHLKKDTTCTSTITDILNNSTSCSNTVFVDPEAPIPAVCGNQSNVDKIDDLNNRSLCSVGTAGVPTESVGSQRYTWSCNSFNGGQSATCFAALNPPVCNIVLNPGTIQLEDTVNYQFNLSGGYDTNASKPYEFSCSAGTFIYSQSSKQTLGNFVVDSSANSLKLNCALTVQGYLQGSSGTCSTEIDILARLLVLKSGAGSGVVSATGIDCGTDCTESYVNGTSVTLTAIADSGSAFAGWNTSDCSTSTATTCTISMTAAKSVSAIFNHTYQLSITKSGTGSGSVTATGLDCGATCSSTYNSGTSVTLTVTPAAGSVFAGWNTGDCTTSTATTCTFTMTATKSVAVVFNQTYQLSITKSGTGTGNVTATDLDCGTNCSSTYNSGTSVTLTVAPAAGSVFAGWNTGDCTTSTATTCTFTMTAAKSVTVVFNQTYQLSITKSGTGSGSVTATEFDCGATCSSTYNSGTSVMLTVAPAVGSVFAGWNTGDCTTSTATTCTFTMTATKSVTVVFNQTYQLSITKSGTGTGSVTTTGLDCGATCSSTYNSGTSITLTVAPATDSAFSGWNTGDCTTSTATTCTFTMTAAKSLTVAFGTRAGTLDSSWSTTGFPYNVDDDQGALLVLADNSVVVTGGFTSGAGGCGDTYNYLMLMGKYLSNSATDTSFTSSNNSGYFLKAYGKSYRTCAYPNDYSITSCSATAGGDGSYLNCVGVNPWKIFLDSNNKINVIGKSYAGGIRTSVYSSTGSYENIMPIWSASGSTNFTNLNLSELFSGFRFWVYGSAGTSSKIVKFTSGTDTADNSYASAGTFSAGTSLTGATPRSIFLSDGSTILATGAHFAKVNATGQYDSSFGGQGNGITAEFPNGGYTYMEPNIQAKVIQTTDGGFLSMNICRVAGGVTRYICFNKVNSNGTADSSFGTNGSMQILSPITNFTSFTAPFNLISQDDGKLLIIYGATLVRYTSAGAIDTSFGTNGSLILPGNVVNGDNAMAFNSDKKYLYILLNNKAKVARVIMK